MNKLTMNKFNAINMSIIITLFCVYIFPSGIIQSSIPIEKTIFTLVITILLFLFTKKISLREIFFITIIIILTIMSRTINYLLFLPLLFLNNVLKEKEQINYFLKNSNILYICLFFTIIYSIMNFGVNGRYAHTAIVEINQSGLSIFCLGLLLMKKNKFLGKFTLLFGMLTISRSYFLALALYIISKTSIGKKISKSKFLIKNSSYLKITIISTILLFLLGMYFINQYKLGNIFWGDNVSTRLFNLLDYSNLFRFMANVAIISIFYLNPKKLLLGITDSEYINFGRKIYSNYGIIYKYTTPHNLFLSHLKLYGFFSIIEVIYVSSILKKVVNKDNLLVYYAIVLYSILLGAGLYSYWLYLTIFVLTSLTKEKSE